MKNQTGNNRSPSTVHDVGHRAVDPAKLAADQAAIAQSMESFSRTQRVVQSREKAKVDAQNFSRSHEAQGMVGQLKETLDKAALERANRKTPLPRLEGAAQIGIKKNTSPV